MILGIIVAAIALMLVLALMQKPDTTTLAQISEATARLEKTLSAAERIVNELAPNNQEALNLLATARRRLQYSAANSRLVVTNSAILSARLQGIELATQAAEIAHRHRQS